MAHSSDVTSSSKPFPTLVLYVPEKGRTCAMYLNELEPFLPFIYWPSDLGQATASLSLLPICNLDRLYHHRAVVKKGATSRFKYVDCSHSL